jgi:cell division ATPase MinD
MVRIINVCSGKGGVGKTVVASNLGIALQKFYKKVAVIDLNLTTSHLSLYFGIFSYPKTLNHFLRNETRLEDAIYIHSSGLRIIPASLELEEIIDINVDNLKESLKRVFHDYDIVILDSAPGLGREALIALQASDEVLFVANPHVPSLVDIVKCNKVINSLDPKPVPLGIVVNRVKNKKYEITLDEIRQFTELPIIGVIPEDENILKSVNKKSLVTFNKQNSSSSKAFFRIAAELVGTYYKEPGIIDRIKRIFVKRDKEFFNRDIP